MFHSFLFLAATASLHSSPSHLNGIRISPPIINPSLLQTAASSALAGSNSRDTRHVPPQHDEVNTNEILQNWFISELFLSMYVFNVTSKFQKLLYGFRKRFVFTGYLIAAVSYLSLDKVPFAGHFRKTSENRP